MPAPSASGRIVSRAGLSPRDLRRSEIVRYAMAMRQQPCESLSRFAQGNRGSVWGKIADAEIDRRKRLEGE